MDKDKKSPEGAKQEPKPGEGVRSLDTWKKLAQARAAHETEGGDPAAYFKRFGIEGLAPNADSGTLEMLDGRLGVVDPLGDARMDARRGAVAVVVAPVAACAINVAGNVNWGVNVNVGANVNTGVNLNVTSNWTRTSGVGRPY